MTNEEHEVFEARRVFDQAKANLRRLLVRPCERALADLIAVLARNGMCLYNRNGARISLDDVGIDLEDDE